VHNAWTSLFFSFLALVGLVFSNVTREKRFTVAYLQLFFTGLGSVVLHSTLTAWGQSMDEVPMLWLAAMIVFCLIEAHASPGRPRVPGLPIFYVLFAFSQTVVYYAFRHLYIIFLISYVSLVVVIIVWTYQLSTMPLCNPLRWTMFRISILSYVVLGVTLWFVFMCYNSNIFDHSCKCGRQFVLLCVSVSSHMHRTRM
jgi:dihydroceramidase